MLFHWLILPIAYVALWASELIRVEAWSRLGLGAVGFRFMILVWRQAGPLRLHLSGFTTLKSPL